MSRRCAGVQLRLARPAGELDQGVALPLALQGLYVIAVRFAGEIGTGNVTSFSYAYLIASALVALASSPLSLVSSVPLTRRGIDDERAAVHVISTSWLALTLIAGAGGRLRARGRAGRARAPRRLLRGKVGASSGGSSST